MWCYAPMTYIVPQSVAFSMKYATKIHIITQSVGFLLQSVAPTNFNIVLQNIVVHHKIGILLKMGYFTKILDSSYIMIRISISGFSLFTCNKILTLFGPGGGGGHICPPL